MKLVTRIPAVLTSLWVVYSLYQIVRFGGAVVIDSETTSRIMAVSNDGAITSAVGLTYHGPAGAVLVVGQALIVAGALAAAVFLNGRRRLPAIGVLVGWTGLWLGNALWLRAHGWQHAASTIAMAVALAMALSWLVSAYLGDRSGRAAA